MEVSNKELIILAQQGNINAFEELVYKYDKQVLSIAARYVDSSDDAKDIYQEVFIRVYRSIKKFKFKSEFSTWLFRITTNVCLSHKTRSGKKKFVSIDQQYTDDESDSGGVLELEDSSATPDEQMHHTDVSESINNALNELSPREKMVFTLKHYEGFKIREIADTLECTDGTVKKYLFTATRKLRDLLQEYA